MPKLTVSIPIYNKEPFLSEAIESVLNQSFKDFELLLINDASTDQSLAIANSYAQKDQRIRIIENKFNLGNIANGNKCLDEAETDIIIRMDADDVMAKDRLILQYDFMENNPQVAIAAGYNVDLDSGNINEKPKYKSTNNFSYLFPFKNPLSQPCSAFRRSIMQHHQLRYDESGPKIGEDWLLFFKASLCTEIAYHHDIVNYYRINQSSISSARDQAYFDDIKNVLRYIMETYHVTVRNENALLFFKKQSCQSIIEEDIQDFKLMLKDFENQYYKYFDTATGDKIKEEILKVKNWLFLRCIYQNKAVLFKKNFKMTAKQKYIYNYLKLKSLIPFFGKK